jgi:hypothetical protein
VEVPGKDDLLIAIIFESLRPPDPRGLPDYVTTPCKKECAIIKQRKYIKQVHMVLSDVDPVRGALMRASAGQCGMDSICCSASTV